MAYPWDLAGDDPLNYGLLAAGGALLTPERQGGGMGAAVTRFGQTVANQRNIDENQQLTKLKIDAYKRDLKLGIEQGDPASVREWKYFSSLTPEKQQHFLDMKRQNYKYFDVGGVINQGHLGTNQAPQPMATIGEVSGNKAHTQRAIEIEKALRDILAGTDPVTNRPVNQTREATAQQLGAPQLSPTLQREMPPGLTQSQVINGMSVPELAAHLRGQPTPSFGGPAQLPAAAGAPALSAEQTRLQEKEKYDAELRANYPKAKGSIQALEATLDQADKQLDKVEKNQAGAKFNTGVMSNLPLSMIRGFSPHQHESDLQTARDMLVVETIKNMKELSKTGATGFGQLSEKEGSRLENAVGNLKIGQRKEDFDAALAEVKKVIKEVKKNARATYELEFGKFRAADDPLGLR